jgi:hypothetical protein
MTTSDGTRLEEPGPAAPAVTPSTPGVPYHTVMTAPPGTWSVPAAVPVAGLPAPSKVLSAAAVAAGPMLFLGVVAAGTGNPACSAVRTNWQQTPSWTSFDSTGQSGVVNARVAAVSGSPVMLTVREADLSLWWATWTQSTGKWSTFENLEGESGTNTQIGAILSPAAAAVGGDLHVCAVNSAGRLYHSIHFGANEDYPAGTWQPFLEINSNMHVPLANVVDVAAASDGSQLHVVALTAGGTVWRAVRQTSGGSWSEWASAPSVNGVGTAYRVSATVLLGSLYVGVVTDHGHAYVGAYDLRTSQWSGAPSGTWRDLATLTGASVGQVSDATLAADGMFLHVAFVANGG